MPCMGLRGTKMRGMIIAQLLRSKYTNCFPLPAGTQSYLRLVMVLGRAPGTDRYVLP